MKGADGYKAWFSLAHKHRHKAIRKCRIAYLTQFSIPAALLNPMINKIIADGQHWIPSAVAPFSPHEIYTW